VSGLKLQTIRDEIVCSFLLRHCFVSIFLGPVSSRTLLANLKTFAMPKPYMAIITMASTVLAVDMMGEFWILVGFG
jgi:hypothetical protein